MCSGLAVLRPCIDVGQTKLDEDPGRSASPSSTPSRRLHATSKACDCTRSEQGTLHFDGDPVFVSLDSADMDWRIEVQI